MFQVLDITTAPGHLIRRVHQVHAVLWAEEVDGDLTPVQFAMLNELCIEDGLDQAAMGWRAGLDRSTTADVAIRLERRGHLVRESDEADGRRRVLRITPSGRAAHQASLPGVARVTKRLVAPLTEVEAAQFLDLLQLVTSESRT